jgi:polyisoprenoid-binding protein YceI
MRSSLTVLLTTAWLACGATWAQPAGTAYTVVPGESDLHWLVYKAGALSRLGHNHTIAAGDLRGTVHVSSGKLEESRFELEFSVADLVVDDPQLRSTLGADFSSVPTADDVAGTRRNMLSEAVLNGDKFPKIRLVGTGPTQRDGAQSLAVTIELLGRSVPVVVPTEVTIDGDVLRAKGQFELNHADLGMQPFSVMMGALQVGEKLSFAYDVVARK